MPRKTIEEVKIENLFVAIISGLAKFDDALWLRSRLTILNLPFDSRVRHFSRQLKWDQTQKRKKGLFFTFNYDNLGIFLINSEWGGGGGFGF